VAGAVITINQPTGAGAGTPGVSRNDIWFGQPVQLVDAGGGNTEWSWELLDQPPGAAASISNPTSQAATLTPTAGIKGTYRVKLTVQGGGTGNVQIRIFRVRFDATGAVHKLGVAAPAHREREGEANYSGARDHVGTVEQALYTLEDEIVNFAGLAGDVNPTPDTLALRDGVGGAEFAALVAATLNAASGQLEVGGSSIGLLLGSASQTTAVVGSEFEISAPSIPFYEGGQSVMTWTLDSTGTSSFLYGADTTISWTQAQSAVGPGRTLTMRAQRGAPGQVGADLVLGVGLGGTAGVNAAGWARIKLGTPVSGATSPFVLEREDGTPIITTYEIATGIVGFYFGSAGGSHQGIIRGASLGLESSSSLVALQPATDLYIGHGSSRDIFHREVGTVVLTEHLDADGQTRFRFADGPTSIVFDQVARATAGAGADWTVQAQQGNGNVGGTLYLKSGAPGVAGTHSGGAVVLDSGAPITGSVAAKISFQAGGVEYLYLQRNVGGGSVGFYNNTDSSVFYAAGVASVLSGGNEAWLGGWTGTRIYTGQADQAIYQEWASAAGVRQQRAYHKTTTTTNATPVNVVLYTPANSRGFIVHADIIGYNDAGNTVYAAYVVNSGRRSAGTVTMGTQNKPHENTNLAASASLAGSGGDVIATLTGVAATNIRWEIYVRVSLCGTFA